MKKLLNLSVLIILLGIAGNGFLNAQSSEMPAPPETSDVHGDIHGDVHGDMHKRNHNAFGIPGLTEEQRAKMKDLRIAHFKDAQALHNQLGELKARQRSLTTMDNPNKQDIEANIDDITKVMNQLMKLQVNHKLQVRALLTPEQRIAYDMKHMDHGHGKMSFDEDTEKDHPVNHPMEHEKK